MVKSIFGGKKNLQHFLETETFVVVSGGVMQLEMAVLLLVMLLLGGVSMKRR
jgi:hypothetical protein